MARLIDSDVVIDHLRGIAPAKEFLLDCFTSEEPLHLSVITHAELWAGLRPGEETGLRDLLSRFQAVAVTQSAAEEAGRYRREFGRSHGVELPDALIAATAKLTGATLYTTNLRHYPMRDITVRRPY